MEPLGVDQLVSMLSVSGAKFSLFVGAGISVQSGVPLATHDLPGLPSVLSSAKHHVFTANNPGAPPTKSTVDAWFAETGFLDSSTNLYGDALELVSPTARGRRNFLQQFFVAKKPSWNHFCIAQLAKHGFLDIVFTTNFDSLLEKAFDECGVPYVVYAHAESMTDMSVLDSGVKLIKLHGDYQYSHIRNTSSETQLLADAHVAAFLHALREYGMVVVGYGGADDSVMSPIQSRFLAENLCPYGLVWVHRIGSNCPERIKAVARTATSRVFSLGVDDIKELFLLLYNRLVPLHTRAGESLSFPSAPERDKVCIKYYRRRPAPVTFFVDREEELDLLVESMDKRTILIKGIAGSGKTFLAARFFQQLESQGLPCFWFSFSEFKNDNPFSVFNEIAGFFRDALEDSELAEFIESTAVNSDNQDFLFSIIQRTLESKRCYLFFDDFQCVGDSALLVFFEQLYRNPSESTVVFVSRSAPQFLRDHVPYSHAETSIVGFNTHNIRQYFIQRGIDISLQVCGKIKRKFAGLPLALDLLLAYANRHQVNLNRVDELIDDTRDYVSDELVSVVYSSLRSDERRALRVLSTSQNPCSVNLLAEYLRFSTQKTRRLLTGLVSDSLVRTEGSRFLIHDILSHYCYGRVRDRRTTHSRLAAVCLTHTDDMELILEGIGHFLKADNNTAASSLILQHADQITRFGSAGAFQNIVDRLDISDIDMGTWLSLQFVRIRLLEQQGEYKLGWVALKGIERLCTERTGSRLKHLYYSGRIQYFLGDYSLAEEYLYQALTSSRSSSNEMNQTAKDSNRVSECLILSQLARRLYVVGYLVAAEKVYDRALSLAIAKRDIIGINKTVHRIAMILSDTGELDRARMLFEQVIATSERINDQKRLSYAKFRLGNIAIQATDYERATYLHQESMSIKEKIGHRRGLVFSYRALARIALATGDLDETMRLINMSLALADELAEKKEYIKTLLSKAWVLNRLGRSEEAEHHAISCLGEVENMGLLKQALKAHLFLSQSVGLSPSERENHNTQAGQIRTELESPASNNAIAWRYDSSIP